MRTGRRPLPAVVFSPCGFGLQQANRGRAVVSKRAVNDVCCCLALGASCCVQDPTAVCHRGGGLLLTACICSVCQLGYVFSFDVKCLLVRSVIARRTRTTHKHIHPLSQSLKRIPVRCERIPNNLSQRLSNFQDSFHKCQRFPSPVFRWMNCTRRSASKAV